MSGQGPSQIHSSSNWVSTVAELRSDNRWVYPQFILRPEERLEGRFNAIAFTFAFVLQEGSGDFHLILDEENGSSYMADFDQVPRRGEEPQIVVQLDTANWGSTWSMPDPNTQLDLERVKSVRIGCHTQGAKMRYLFKDLRWLRL